MPSSDSTSSQQQRAPTGPLLLDLYSKAGGAARGYQQAGFYVIGVDLDAQPRYAGDEHYQADAIAVLQFLIAGNEWRGRILSDFAAIHASPPCQMYSRALRHMAHEQPMLIDATRDLLNATGVPWIIENVEGAPLPRQSNLFGAHGVMLCGTSFGMRVYRHRLFETSFPVCGPSCAHTAPAMNPHNSAAREAIYSELGKRSGTERLWRRETGVEWMNRHEGRESIPPAYTRHIGLQIPVGAPLE